jgi:hypothetical protein
VAEALELLFCKHEALSSNPSLTKKFFKSLLSDTVILAQNCEEHGTPGLVITDKEQKTGWQRDLKDAPGLGFEYH